MLHPKDKSKRHSEDEIVHSGNISNQELDKDKSLSIDKPRKKREERPAGKSIQRRDKSSDTKI